MSWRPRLSLSPDAREELREALPGAALVASGLLILFGVYGLYGWEPSPWGFAAAAAVLAVPAVTDAVRRLRRRQGRVLGEARQRAAELRRNPAPHLLRGPGPDGEAAPLLEEVHALADSYREALDELVRLRERVEEMEDATGAVPVGTDAGGSGRLGSGRATHYLAASSRHRMVARLAPNLHWIAATGPLLQLLGRGLPDLVARPFLDVVHSEDALALEQTLREALEDGEAHNLVFRVRVPAADGLMDERTLQADVMTAFTEARVPLHLRCHFLDVTDRVRTEAELRRRTEELSQANARLLRTNDELQRLKESYRDLYHQAPVLYFSVDGLGHLVACNETMLRTLGHARDELLGRPYARLLTPRGRVAFLGDPAVFQRPGELETQWVKADGTVIDVWIATTVIRDERGAFLRSRSAARDATEPKRLANALKAKADEVALANAHLRRVNQELEDFTYVVSHDLKEPLRTLEAFSNFLALDYGPELGEEGQDHIRHLTAASRRLGRLIDDLLALSRSGRVIHAPRPFSWDEIIATVLADLGDMIARKQASVRVDGPLPPAFGDPERVIQLLSNLVANGLKYNQNDGPEVVLGAVEPAAAAALRWPAPPGFVTLFVRDNGVGIDPEYHEQIFRVFRRLHRQDEVEGTGAGLAICKRIVEAHGGWIWVESQAGHGATFCFTLPRHEPPAAPEPVAAAVPAAPDALAGVGLS
jgi:PAS domain S-box-containing protein